MDISAVLKMIGILVAGVLGVLGTITETRNKETGRLTYWGRCALALTVAGSLLALGSQIVDSVTESQRDHTILEDLQEQSKKTNNVLNQDSDILSRIRELRRITFSLKTVTS